MGSSPWNLGKSNLRFLIELRVEDSEFPLLLLIRRAWEPEFRICWRFSSVSTTFCMNPAMVCNCSGFLVMHVHDSQRSLLKPPVSLNFASLNFVNWDFVKWNVFLSWWYERIRGSDTKC